VWAAHTKKVLEDTKHRRMNVIAAIRRIMIMIHNIAYAPFFSKVQIF